MKYFVFKICYDSRFDDIISEIKNGVLRQGWGGPELDLRNGYDKFLKNYKNWDMHKVDGDIWKDYKQLRKMLNIEKGDLIVVPKSSHRSLEDKDHKFIILEATGPYYFDLFKKYNDFGHCIPIKIIGTVHYDYNMCSTLIASKFGYPYQARLNSVLKFDVQQAISSLCEDIKNNKNTEKSRSNILDIIVEDTVKDRLLLRNRIKKNLSDIGNHQFEDLITELFNRNGYEKIDGNQFDGKGADVDIEFQLAQSDSLIASLFKKNQDIDNVTLPNIRVQAKKKTGVDMNDKIAIEQLIKSVGSDDNINIVISSADIFTDETMNLANKEKVILLNGDMLAELILEYGKIFINQI